MCFPYSPFGVFYSHLFYSLPPFFSSFIFFSFLSPFFPDLPLPLCSRFSVPRHGRHWRGVMRPATEAHESGEVGGGDGLSSAGTTASSGGEEVRDREGDLARGRAEIGEIHSGSSDWAEERALREIEAQGFGLYDYRIEVEAAIEVRVKICTQFMISCCF
ncbi:hypothetical protein Dimus_038480 [Dionaea muscipula]